jgi:Zn-finger nucleic acid-binding protein
MNCPVCERQLKERTVSGIVVDVCDGGCGGIWFDCYELQKVDEPHETAGESLLDIPKDPRVRVDFKKRRFCPKCHDAVMMRHFASIKREVEVDECPKCGGFWLDADELKQIRKQYRSEEERTQAAKQLFTEITERSFADIHAESREKMERRRKMARMFRFVCPSYYIPGDQKWGAF